MPRNGLFPTVSISSRSGIASLRDSSSGFLINPKSMEEAWESMDILKP